MTKTSDVEGHPPDDDVPVPDQVPVHEAIRRAMYDIGAIGRGGQMSQGEKYLYRKLDDLLAAVQPALVRHGIVLYPVASTATYVDKTSKQGNAMQWISLEVEWGVIGPMGDRLTPAPITVGEANDSSDKATNKAHSAAQKVCLAQLFNVPYSADDQDAGRQELGHRGQHVEPTVNELWDAAAEGEASKANALQDRLDHLPADLAEKALGKASTRAQTNIERIIDLPPSWLPWWTGLLAEAEKAAEA